MKPTHPMGYIMSYDLALLFSQAVEHLAKNPSMTLRALSQTLHVSRRTVENAIHLSTGQTFRHFRDDMILRSVKMHFASSPDMAIKEVAFALGFNSASSFARAIRRACGCSPVGLRSQIRPAPRLTSRKPDHTKL